MQSANPNADEAYAFETNGYLVLPEFLPPDHVRRLLETLETTIARRRQLAQDGIATNGETQIDGPSTRIFHILEESPDLLDAMDYPDLMTYVRSFLNPNPHFHASDAIWEVGTQPRDAGWHMDGMWGFGALPRPIPHMQLKVGYYLSDMREPDQGNLMLVPGSHRNPDPAMPSADQRGGFDTMPGAVQVCGPPGTTVMFHNAVWHTGGPRTRTDGSRIMLYYAYEHSFMMAGPEPWSYSPAFYAGLSPERRKLFHGFVFDPPELRYG